MTPEEFEREARLLADGTLDNVEAHIEADKLMERTLSNLGYAKGIDVLSKIHKWYE